VRETAKIKVYRALSAFTYLVGHRYAKRYE
jgi:hypothetical protein